MTTIEDFFDVEEPVKWGNSIEKEIRRRIKLAIAAYSYEFLDVSVIPDSEFDKMSLEVDLSAETGNKLMDNFFKTHFDPSTGQWIRKHPQLDSIDKLYKLYYEDKYA